MTPAPSIHKQQPSETKGIAVRTAAPTPHSIAPFHARFHWIALWGGAWAVVPCVHGVGGGGGGGTEADVVYPGASGAGVGTCSGSPSGGATRICGAPQCGQNAVPSGMSV